MYESLMSIAGSESSRNASKMICVPKMNREVLRVWNDMRVSN